MKIVKLSSAILDVVEETSDLYANKRPWLLKHAKRAFKNIGSPYQYLPVIEVYNVINFRDVLLSENVVSVMDIIPGDHGTTCWNLFHCGFNSIDLAYIASQEQWIGINALPISAGNYDYGYNVLGNTLTFDNIVSFDKVTILSRNNVFDVSGELLIPDECLEAISKYLEWKIGEVDLKQAMRKGENNYVMSKYVSNLELQYNRLVLRTRGRLNAMQVTETQNLMEYFTK